MRKINFKNPLVRRTPTKSLFTGISCMALFAVLLTSCSPDEPVQMSETGANAQLNVQEAAPGDRVVISGSGFESANVQVKFAGEEAKIVSVTDAQLVVEVPANAKTGEVTLTVNGISHVIKNLFSIILNRIRPTYWIEVDAEGNSLIVRGTADLQGNTAKTTLYSTANIISALSLESMTSELFWVEQMLDFETFEITSTIYKSCTGTITPETVVTGRGTVTSLTVSLPDNKLYWTEPSALYQAAFNGSGISLLYANSLLSSVASLKYDEVNNNLYFIQSSRQLVLAHADSSGIATIYSTSNPRRFQGVGVDVNSDRLFVASLGLPGDETDYILYGNLAGSVALDTLVHPVTDGTEPNPVVNTSSLDVDRIGNFLYWLNAGVIEGDGSLYRIKLNGTASPQLIFDNISTGSSVDVRGKSEVKLYPGTSLQ